MDSGKQIRFEKIAFFKNYARNLYTSLTYDIKG